MTNELTASVLNGEYMPSIILGREPNFQIWIIDGLQRSTALIIFRYGNYRITSSIEEPAISYRAKSKDAEGNIKADYYKDYYVEMELLDKLKTMVGNKRFDLIMNSHKIEDQQEEIEELEQTIRMLQIQ